MCDRDEPAANSFSVKRIDTQLATSEQSHLGLIAISEVESDCRVTFPLGPSPSPRRRSSNLVSGEAIAAGSFAIETPPAASALPLTSNRNLPGKLGKQIGQPRTPFPSQIEND